MTFPVLIPSASYRFINFVDGKPTISKKAAAKSGETYVMGDVKVDMGE